jgi:Flp pilus assembly protein TadG
MHLRSPRFSAKRPGKFLVMFALLLPVLLGMVGLTIDGGLMMAGQRQAQDAADAGAVAAAKDLLRGQSQATAKATAITFVQQYNGLPNAQVTVNIPPKTGPYSGNSHYVEVYVTNAVSTNFIHVVGVGASQNVTARAVAGYEAVTIGEGVITLSPTAVPGLSVSGNGSLKVNGRIVVNSQGQGVDRNGNTINLGYPAYAAETNGGHAYVYANNVQVVGGVNSTSNFLMYDGSSGTPVYAGQLPEPDPLETLPTPTVPLNYWKLNAAGNGVVSASSPQVINLSTQGSTNYTFSPGIYTSISITGSGSGTVTFQPGIYVFGPGLTSSGGNTLSVTAKTPVVGNGVMFYNTGSDFNAATGAPDNADGTASPAPPASTYFGGISFGGNAKVTLTPLSDPTSPFYGMVIYQRRWNTSTDSIAGNSGSTSITGTLYSKWGPASISGNGTFSTQFIVGSLSTSGNGTFTLNSAGNNAAKANQVYLVE